MDQKFFISLAWGSSSLLLVGGVVALLYFLQGSPYLLLVVALYVLLGVAILLMKVTLVKRLLKPPRATDGTRS